MGFELVVAGFFLRVPAGNLARFHVGDLVLIRRNDRHQQAVQGDAVLNGYRGVVTAVTPTGVEVEWRDPAAEADVPPSRAVLSAGYIAQGGLELGYALTAHKAEGLTVGGTWRRPDGTTNHGSVLVYGPGMDNPGLYVSRSRDKGQVTLFGARAELEGEREDLVYGPPRNQIELTDRVIAALAEKAAVTAENANDRPVLVDLGQAPADLGTTTKPPEPAPASAPPPARPRVRRPAWAPPPQRERASQPGREPARAGMTEEQRSRWRLLGLRERAAQLAGNQEALEAIQADKRAVLDLPEPQQARQQRDAARAAQAAEREARPHSRVTDKQLTTAVGEAEQRQARERAAADAARREVAAREPEVAAGRGPRVTQVDAERDRLRQRAEVQSWAEDIQRRWQAVTERAADAAERAAVTDFDAERTRRWQSGKRERLQAEAAEHRAERDRAAEEAKELARQAAELQQELGGPRVWRLAREQAEQAEARYPDDRQEAQRGDETELTRMQQCSDRHDLAAAEAGTHRDELIAEQQLRDVMSQDQRIAETGWRIQASQQNVTRALEQLAAQRDLEPEPDLAPHSAEWEPDYHERTMDRGLDIDPGGPSFGR